MVSIKRITAGLLGLAIAGILIMGCEKFDGPEPFLSKRLDLNQLVLISAAEPGEVPLGPAIPLNSLERLIISDVGMMAVVDIPEYADGIPIELVRKIIFQ